MNKIICLLFLFLFLIFSIRSESYLTCKIIHLVLYSESDDYHKMYEVTRPYYKKFQNVITLYYTYSGTSDPAYVKDDILYLPGTESFIPGVLNKTIDAFQWVTDHYDFEYIIRSNISTVVDISGVISALLDYGGGFVNLLEMSQGYGVKEEHVGTIYASGTSIILSREFVNELLKTRHEIDYSVIDDVAIGLWAKEKYEVKQLNGTLFYRNRSPNREIDIVNMKQQIELID